MSNFNFEKWLRENTDFDDTDSALVIYSSRRGEVVIKSFDGEISSSGRTLEEACKQFELDSELED
jgi:hypothetical protein